jgi:hypothetical protein
MTTLPVEQISAAVTISYVNGMCEGIFKYCQALGLEEVNRLMEQARADWAEEMKKARECVTTAQVAPKPIETPNIDGKPLYHIGVDQGSKLIGLFIPEEEKPVAVLDCGNLDTKQAGGFFEILQKVIIRAHNHMQNVKK